MVSRTEQLAEAMAARHGYATGEHRYPYMVGVMASAAEELERILAEIAKPTTSASLARVLAANALASLSTRSQS